MVDEADIDWSTTDKGEIAYRRKKLASEAGGDLIGASLYELDPGKRSWPLHFHTANEEAIYVLRGEGTLRRGDTKPAESLGPGEYVALPANPSGTHQVVNDGDEVLRYLMVSTMVDPDVTVYPESDRVGIFAGAPPGGEGDRTVAGFWNREDAVDYWD